MDDAGFSYRCLPINIANQHGWVIKNEVSFVAEWDGRDTLEGVRVGSLERDLKADAISHFGFGILTFKIPCLMRTERGFDLIVTGPINEFKDGIQPITGVVECGWLPFTFTMNWKFTRPNHPVVFMRDDPVCMFFPIERGTIEKTDPEYRHVDEEKELAQEYRKWEASRLAFNMDLKDPKSTASREKWQKHYFQGRGDAVAAPRDHKTKLDLKPFR